jgi:hypothetical protein
VNDGGIPVQIRHVSERRGTGNVFLVPESRISLFMEAAGHRVIE